MEDEGADLLWLDARPLEEVAQARADHLLEGEGEGEGEGSRQGAGEGEGPLEEVAQATCGSAPPPPRALPAS